MSTPKYIPRQDQLGIVAFVTKIDGSPVDAEMLQKSNKDLEGLYAIPLMSDFKNRSTAQRVGYVEPSVLRQMKKEHKGGIDISAGYGLLDEIVLKSASQVRQLVCLNDSSFADEHTGYGGFLRVFGGRASPTLDETFTNSYAVPFSGVNIRWRLCNARDYMCIPPLWICLFDPTFHHRQITSQDVEIVKRAVGPQGTYPSRTVNCSTGLNCYDGFKSPSSQCHPTPSEGPGMKGLYKYYRNVIDAKFYGHYVKLITDLGNKASWMTSHFYRHLRVLFPEQNTGSALLWIGRFAILTIQFANTEHIDKRDLVKDLFQVFLNKLTTILNNPSLPKKHRDEVVHAKSFVEDFGVGVPTTCGVQFVPRNKELSYENCGVEACQLFLMGGIGMCSRMNNYWAHMFMSHVCVHQTSVPIFISNGVAYIGVCEDLDIFAWGKGPP